MLPKTLALVDDNKEYVELLSQHLEDHGIKVDVFHDSNDLLIHPEPYHYDFYIIDLMLPGVDGVNTIELIRKRSRAGLLVISGRALGDAFKLAIEAGATAGWWKFVGSEGDVIGLDRFGASAPGPKVAEELGFSPAAIAAKAKSLIK